MRPREQTPATWIAGLGDHGSRSELENELERVGDEDDLLDLGQVVARRNHELGWIAPSVLVLNRRDAKS